VDLFCLKHRNGTIRSRPLRSTLIRRLQTVIHPKGYGPISTEHVAALC
jgi:hypothetical protein